MQVEDRGKKVNSQKWVSVLNKLQKKSSVIFYSITIIAAPFLVVETTLHLVFYVSSFGVSSISREGLEFGCKQ